MGRSTIVRGTMFGGQRKALCAALAFSAMTLAGCESKKTPVASTPPPPTATPATTSLTAPSSPQPKPGLSPRDRYKLSLSLLQRGEEAQARAELAQLQKDTPADQRVTSLLREIDEDPKALYGTDSFTYTMQAGDTLFSLAKAYLHNPLNFYGLARYNGLKLPVDLKPGQTISIPGKAREPERAASLWHRPAQPAATTEVPAAAPASPDGQSKAHARELRRQGLEQMSAGSIDRAVTLLSQAASLDPTDAAIGNDLSRARRIQATVRSK